MTGKVSLEISFPFPGNGCPRATIYIDRGPELQPFEVFIDYGRNKYDTWKLTLSPSRAVNPPACQYFGGVKSRYEIQFHGPIDHNMPEPDNRVEACTNYLLDPDYGLRSAYHMPVDVPTPGQAALIRALIPLAFETLDATEHREPKSVLTAAGKRK